jgi:hypothetical protein
MDSGRWWWWELCTSTLLSFREVGVICRNWVVERYLFGCLFDSGWCLWCGWFVEDPSLIVIFKV